MTSYNRPRRVRFCRCELLCRFSKTCE